MACVLSVWVGRSFRREGTFRESNDGESLVKLVRLLALAKRVFSGVVCRWDLSQSGFGVLFDE